MATRLADYEAVSELASGDYLLEEVRHAGKSFWRASFALSSPEAQRNFEGYCADLAQFRPAAYKAHEQTEGRGFVLWEAAELLRPEELLPSDPSARESLVRLAQRLAPQGYALPDAELVREGEALRLGYLHPSARTPAEVRAANEALLGVPARELPAESLAEPPASGSGIWGWFPGLLLLAGAGYLGVGAANAYLNPPLGSVPAVIGKAGQEAADAVAAAGYRVQVVEGEAPGRPVGSVIGQQPQSGASLPLGRQVVVTINEPPDLTAPDLSDMTLAQARTALAENQLQLGQTLTVDGTATGTGERRIVGQIPAPGSLTARGQDVRLLVSGGIREEETWLPDLTGLSFEEARAYARAAGLIVNRVQTRISEAPEGTVVSQTPEPYASSEVGGPVTLVIARTSRLAVAENPLRPPEVGREEALNWEARLDYTFSENLPEGSLEIWVRDQDGERPIMAPTPTASLAGQRAEADVPVRGDAEFLLVLDGTIYEVFSPL